MPSKDSHFKAFGPKDPIIKGFGAILMLRVRVLGIGVEGAGFYFLRAFSVACAPKPNWVQGLGFRASGL